MNAVDVSKALKRAATVHDIHENLSTEDLNRYHKDFHTGILTPKLKRLLGKYLHVRKPSDYLTVYIVYRSMFSYMKWELYTSLFREIALNPALKMKRDNLKRLMRTNLKRMTKRLSNKQGKAVHGGFIFAATATKYIKFEFDMEFLDIKDPAKRATLVKEYGTAMKTVKHRNMVNREMKLAIGDELQTLFHPIVNATKHAAEDTRKELASMKKTLTDIYGALAAQRIDARPPPSKTADTTFVFYKKDGQLITGYKAVRLDIKRKILTVDDTVYKLTPGLLELITNKHTRPDQYNSNDKEVYRSFVAQTRVKSFPNSTYGALPHATWKWKYMLKKMFIPGERIAEEEGSEDTGDTGTASIGDIGESSDILSSDISSPGTSDIPPSPARTRSYGKAK